MMVAEARSYLGVRESIANDGEFVRLFQSAVGKAEREPWCISFIQHNVKKVDALVEALLDGGWHVPLLPFDAPSKTGLFETEHALTLWNTSVERRYAPEPGLIALWRHGDSQRGHGGIVEAVNDDGTFTTIEGNTNEAGSREGDGVYRKTRALGGTGEMKLLGFVDPWP
jgi:hypothetical protein